MSQARYVCGIDLGTTNSTLAATQLDTSAVEVHDFAVAQLSKPSTVVERDSLPSFVYLPQADELPANALHLPWSTQMEYMVGTGARERGAQVPLRMISSAKSWLSHAAIDRRGAILPHASPPDVPKMSPIAASAAYLTHLKLAWNAAHPEDPLEQQQVYLTVPASFDAAAKDLTLEAASAAGLTSVSLLEEPQAAFYAWLHRVQDAWRDHVSAGDRILVCDIGGGTTDFSLIEVKDNAGELSLERIAVGDHILLGGDNMDLALAHHLHEKLRQANKKLDASQQRSLIQAARTAKEKLLADASLESEPIVILGRGSKLIGGKIKTELTRAEIETLLIDGFFPTCALTDSPTEQPRTGFMQIGLPFASEPEITKHLAQFLQRHGSSDRPVTHVLLNGGVFNAPILSERLMQIISSWMPQAPQLIEDADHNLAVARGAAYLGAIRQSGGIRIRAGTARSYYIGIETPMPSVPGVRPPINALCIVPIGMEEGSSAQIPGGGQAVEFRFLSSSLRKQDQVGSMLDQYTWPDHLTEGAPLFMTLQAENLEPGSVVPVRLEVHVTEIGTVEIWAVAQSEGHRWRLEFNVRETSEI